MMKISGIVIGLLSASIVAVTPPTPSTGITLEMYDIGPYELLQSDPTENYIINNYYSSAIIINELFRFGDEDNPNQQTFKTALHRVEKGGRYTGEVTLPTSIFLGNDGMKVTIEVYFTRTSEKIYSREFTIYPIEGKTIDPTTMDSYSVTGKRININIRKVNPFTETMTFSRFYDYFLTSVYYRLPIEQFSYTTNVDIDEFNVGSAFLVISGLKDYFPGLTYFNDEARIPLVNIYSEGTISFAFRYTLYVEPTLLLMSTSPKTGYRATNNFYFPVNHIDDLMGATFTFEINEVGLDKTNFRWSTSLLAANGMIGDCQNSSYCVVGRVNQ